MSVNYADGLSKYDNKGVCGTPEIFDEPDKLSVKVDILADLIKKSKHCVLYVGAGLSTSAGIPDFRGPNGVWTLEKQNERSNKRMKKQKNEEENDKTVEVSSIKPKITFSECLPTYSHRAIRALLKHGMVKFIVSQNVDGLFVKDGIERKFIAELHGNYFVHECSNCFERFIRNRPSTTMGCKNSGIKCPRKRPCRGYLHDTILDWEQSLPEKELLAAENASKLSDLSICLGTTLQIEPAGSLPLKVIKNNRKRKFDYKKSQEKNKKSQLEVDEIKTDETSIKKEQEDNKNEAEIDGKLVIINLQKTRFDSKAHLVIHHYLDDVFRMLLERLNLPVPEYNPSNDPTLSTANDLKPF